jgi:acyl carrier protein
MERSQIEQMVFDALEAVNQSLVDEEQIEISPDAKLYGKGGQMGSMTLVALLLDIEEALQDEGVHVALSDEKAMSQYKSPFRDVPSLVNYIQSLIGQTE